MNFDKLPQPNVKLTYEFIATTNIVEHGTDQILCKLKLTSDVRDGMLSTSPALF